MFRWKSLINGCRYPIHRFLNGQETHLRQKFFTTATSLPDPAALNILPKSDMKEFESYYPIIFNDIVKNKLVSGIPKLNERLGRILNYNAPAGRKLRPYLMIATYKFFTRKEDRTPEDIRLMNILGWFIELKTTLLSRVCRIDVLIPSMGMRAIFFSHWEKWKSCLEASSSPASPMTTVIDAPIEIQLTTNSAIFPVLTQHKHEMNAAYVIQDDIVDNSETRRGIPTWFKCKDVGIKAVLDGVLIESTCIQLLKKHFSAHRNYRLMLDEFLNMLRITRVGLVVEAATTSLDEFSSETYNQIAEGKMGYYLLHFTTTMGILLANREDLMISQKAGRVFNELGHLYTIQNDYMDLFGEQITGKLGSDIQEGQLTWPIVLALQKATINQRKILEESYGSYDSEKVTQVKQIYDELEIFSQYEVVVNQIHTRIASEIKKIPDDDIRIFAEKLAKIFSREDQTSTLFTGS